MNPSQYWLGWYKVKVAVGGQLDKILAATSFWQLGFWAQIFAVVAVILVSSAICLGPFLFTAARLLRNGDRPGPVGIVAVLVSVPCGLVLLPLLGRLMQHVLERHPGPIL